MILYNVTINIDNSSHDEWLHWMKSKHVPEQMATGLFVKNTVLKLMNEEDNGGTTYAFQYFLNSLADLEAYEKTYGAVFQAEHQQRFNDKFVAFRTILEVIA
jgi:hypothetical protein